MNNESQLIVDFYGICTHMDHDGKRRAVLVNASNPQRFSRVPKLRDIAAHHAIFQVEPGDLLTKELPNEPRFRILAKTDEYIAWKMDGVTITVPNAEPLGPEPQPLTCIPHLSSLCPVLPEPGPAARDRNPEWTACFFDYVPTRLEGRRTTGGAAVGRVPLTTAGAPQISIAPFDGRGSWSLELRPGARVVVANVPVDTMFDKTQDFYLHFVTVMKDLTADDFPRDASTPPPATGCDHIGILLGPLGGPDITTPGCSNSNYP